MRYLDHAHLAYCTNIHPAETWAETLAMLTRDVLPVRQQFPADQPYAVGLRLSAQAANTLCTEESARAELRAWLDEHNAYLFTINGFPYGAFHNARVKENVYCPDWTTPERLQYTLQLANLIAEFSPKDVEGSVSTLPGSFKAFDADEQLMFANLYATARHLETLSEEYGKKIHLGLEPEPLGHFENTAETIAFFDRFQDWTRKRDLPFDRVLTHLGINYDTCHFALEFEEAEKSIAELRAAGLFISKLHLSNALSFDPQNPEAVAALEPFIEPTYLHQVLLKTDPLTRYQDLPDYLEAVKTGTAPEAKEGRVHFHVPLYQEPLAPLNSTLNHASKALQLLKDDPTLCTHLEIETYTWGVLPKPLQIPLTQQLTKEYHWVLEQ